MQEVPQEALEVVANWLESMVDDDSEEVTFGHGEVFAWRRGKLQVHVALAARGLEQVLIGLEVEKEASGENAVPTSSELTDTLAWDERR